MAATITQWIDEFLYRGRAPDDSTEPAWHVIIHTRIDDGEGNVALAAPKIMSIQQAQEAGWDLSKVLAEINSEALVQVGSLQAALDTANTELETVTSQRDALAAAATPAMRAQVGAMGDVPVFLRIPGSA